MLHKIIKGKVLVIFNNYINTLKFNKKYQMIIFFKGDSFRLCLISLKETVQES